MIWYIHTHIRLVKGDKPFLCFLSSFDLYILSFCYFYFLTRSYCCNFTILWVFFSTQRFHRFHTLSFSMFILSFSLFSPFVRSSPLDKKNIVCLLNRHYCRHFNNCCHCVCVIFKSHLHYNLSPHHRHFTTTLPSALKMMKPLFAIKNVP